MGLGRESGGPSKLRMNKPPHSKKDGPRNFRGPLPFAEAGEKLGHANLCHGEGWLCVVEEERANRNS